MPIGTCDPATRGATYNELTIERPAPNSSGSVLAEVHYTWDGTSVRPNCNGPVIFIRTRNTSNMPAWANLPAKKRGSTWIQIDPGTDVTTTSAGQINNLGLSTAADIAFVDVVFTQPV